MENSKPRFIQDYDKLKTETQEQIKLTYPLGFSQHLIEIPAKDGGTVLALPFETEDKIYMVRMTVRKAEEIIRDDDDYDDEGILKERIKEKYEEEYSDLEFWGSEDEDNDGDDDADEDDY